MNRGNAAKKLGDVSSRSGSRSLRRVRWMPASSAVRAAAAPSVAAESMNVSIGSSPLMLSRARAPVRRQVSVGEPILGQVVENGGAVRSGQAGAGVGLEQIGHSRLAADDEEAVLDRPGGPAAADRDLGAAGVDRRLLRAEQLGGEGLGAVRVRGRDHHRPLDRGPGGQQGNGHLAAGPGFDLALEVDPHAGELRQPADRDPAEQRHPAGELGRGLDLIGVTVDVEVDVGEGVVGHERDRVVTRGAAVAAGKAARSYGDEHEVDERRRHRDDDGGDDPRPGRLRVGVSVGLPGLVPTVPAVRTTGEPAANRSEPDARRAASGADVAERRAAGGQSPLASRPLACRGTRSASGRARASACVSPAARRA